MPVALQGKPIRYIQRTINQRLYDYPHRNLLIIGQPKSGSTWLFRMVKEVPGYLQFVPSNIKLTNLHELRREDFIPAPVGYTVTKTHTSATPDNLRIIHDTNRPFTVLMRDPRDLAVSWAYYVGLPYRDEWSWPDAVKLSIPERITFYIENVLPRTSRWPLDWRDAVASGPPHPGIPGRTQGLFLRYEDMLADCHAVMRRVFEHYQVSLTDEQVNAICARHSFKSATGREPGQQDSQSFNRKGISGDWRNHFSPAQIDAFKRVAGKQLIELGYATDLNW